MLAKILLAASPKVKPLLDRCLSCEYDLLPVKTVEEALTVVRQNRPAVIIATDLFDESRMFELLRQVKADPDLCKIPFIACRAVRSKLHHIYAESLEIASTMLGACAFIDLASLPAEKQAPTLLRVLSECLPTCQARPEDSLYQRQKHHTRHSGTDDLSGFTR